MFEARRMALCMAGLLLSAASYADGAGSTNAGVEHPSIVPASIDELLRQSALEANWQIAYPATIVVEQSPQLHGVADLKFRDSSALSRVGRLRSLSLLTLAKVGRTQVFLGINDDGLVGLHFKSFRPRESERHLELLRMDYLKDDGPEEASPK